MDLEVVPKWHVFAYYTLLGCFKDVPQVRLGNGDSQEEDIEPKGNGVLDIHDDSPIIAYLQVGEIPIKLTIKDGTRLFIGPSNSNGKVIPYYECG